MYPSTDVKLQSCPSSEAMALVAPKKCLYQIHCTNPAEKLGVIWRLLQSMEVLLGWRANIYSVNTKICMKFKYITYDCSIRVSVHVVLEVSLIVSPQSESCAWWARHGVVMGSAPSHLPQLLQARQARQVIPVFPGEYKLGPTASSSVSGACSPTAGVLAGPEDEETQAGERETPAKSVECCDPRRHRKKTPPSRAAWQVVRSETQAKELYDRLWFSRGTGDLCVRDVILEVSLGSYRENPCILSSLSYGQGGQRLVVREAPLAYRGGVGPVWIGGWFRRIVGDVPEGGWNIRLHPGDKLTHEAWAGRDFHEGDPRGGQSRGSARRLVSTFDGAARRLLPVDWGSWLTLFGAGRTAPMQATFVRLWRGAERHPAS